MLEADGNAVVQKEFPRDISTSTATASTGVTGGAAGGVQRRMFDAVFAPHCSNDTLATHLRPVVDHVLAGYNSMLYYIYSIYYIYNSSYSILHLLYILLHILSL